MRRPAPLPDAIALHVPFAAADARRHGVSKRRLEASDLLTPYRGARLAADAEPSVANLAAAYARRMPPTHFFSHSTAALLNGVPLPLRLEADGEVVIGAIDGPQSLTAEEGETVRLRMLASQGRRSHQW
jgi:hypothetical protein